VRCVRWELRGVLGLSSTLLTSELLRPYSRTTTTCCVVDTYPAVSQRLVQHQLLRRSETVGPCASCALCVLCIGPNGVLFCRLSARLYGE
jgi:hypothetical protein